jgi:peptidoglycan/LPS O-acetylase OafA/YrhL
MNQKKLIPNTEYRPDIDGLRALAVISVLLFHLYPRFLPGGFIGVDIFFVISGYLITKIIVSKRVNEKFSFCEFYRNRVLRIFPALLVVLCASLILGKWLLYSEDYLRLVKGVLNGALFTENFLLISEGGYFSHSAITMPMLHLWSLSVEEQFYLIWPLYLFVFGISIKNIRFAIFLITFISFFINIYLSNTNAIVDFYSPISRLWELGVGGILAVNFVRGSTLKNNLLANNFNQIFSILGITLVCYGLIVIDGGIVYPGYWALLPIIGTTFLISSKNSWVNKNILSNSLLVWVGKISYPLYLIHWTLISFLYILNGELNNLTKIIVLVISVALSWGISTYIEPYFRFSGVGRNYKSALLVALMAGVALFSWGSFFQMRNLQVESYGIPNFNTPSDKQSSDIQIPSHSQNDSSVNLINPSKPAVALGPIYEPNFNDKDIPVNENDTRIRKYGDIDNEVINKYTKDNFFPCQPKRIYDESPMFSGGRICFQSKKDAPIDIAIIGDSHGQDFFIGLAEIFYNKNVVLYIKIKPNSDFLPHSNEPEFKNIYDYVISDKNISTVIIDAFWTNKISNSELSEGAGFANRLLMMRESVNKLTDSGKFVFVANDYPNFPFDASDCKYRGICSISTSLSDAKPIYQSFLQAVVMGNPKAKILDTVSPFCDSTYCYMNAGNKLLYRDTNHLNIYGSRFLAANIYKEVALKIR